MYKWPGPTCRNLAQHIGVLQAESTGSSDVLTLFTMLSLEVFPYYGSNTICILVYTPGQK